MVGIYFYLPTFSVPEPILTGGIPFPLLTVFLNSRKGLATVDKHTQSIFLVFSY